MSGYSDPRPGVSCIVTYDDGTVLCGVRRGSHGAGRLALPGGRIDPKETPQQTAVRELKEETGLDAYDVRLVPYVSTDLFDAERQHWTCLYVAMRADGEPQLLEPGKCEGWTRVRLDAQDLPAAPFGGLAALLEPGVLQALLDAPPVITSVSRQA